MRVLLVALKWTTSLNKTLASKATTEHSCTRCYYRNRFRSLSKRFVNNGETFSYNIDNVEARKFTTTCILSKSKDKEKKPKHGKIQQIDRNELGQVVDIEHLTSNFDKSVNDLRANFVKNLTLRSSTGSIEQVNVNFDGHDYMLQELVEISRKPKTVVLNVTSFPQAIPQVLEALSKSGMNLNPQQDGTTIFIPIPKVTKEHRENLSKNAKTLYIKCRDVIKDIRNKEIRNLKKKPSISEDTSRRVQAQIEALGDQYIKDAEKILETKQKELLGSSD